MDGYNEFLSKLIKIREAGTVYPTAIQLGSIDNSMIKGLSITASKIADSTITGSKIVGGTITARNIANSTITGAKIVDSTITAGKISVSSLSSISANIGTITAGTITGVTISSSTFVLPYGTVGSTGSLRWADGTSKIWVDTASSMGLRANGGHVYLYGGSTEIASFHLNAQAVLRYGAYLYGNLNVAGNANITGYLIVGNGTSGDYLRVNTYSTMFGIVYMNNFSIRDIGAVTFNAQEIAANNQLFVRASDGKLVFRDSNGSDYALY